jgi:hypothetical protein
LYPASNKAGVAAFNKNTAHGFWQNKEDLSAAIILALAMVIRTIDIFTRYFDPDEPQHLHVIWSWAHGYVQYRDFFDNHTPLFHMLYAPFFALLPQWDGVLYIMRIAVVPCYVATLWCVYLLGKKLFSPRAGLWAMVMLALYRPFFIKMLEFRTDTLWTFLLILGVYLMIRTPPTRKSVFLAGVVFGTALAVSFKTMILLVALGISMPLASAIAGSCSVSDIRKGLIDCCYGIAGLLVVPAALVIIFYFLDALPDLYYGVIQHNIVAHGNARLDFGLIKDKRVIQFLLWMISTGLIALYIKSVTQDAGNRFKRILVMATGMSYIGVTYAFWPLITDQTLLPGYPLLIGSLVPFLTGEYPLLGKTLGRSIKAGTGSLVPLSTILLTAIAIAQLGVLAKESDSFGWHLSPELQVWKDVLKYTDADDYVMDAKGESVFRVRPYFLGFEHITMQLVSDGAIPDDAADSLVARPTHMVVAWSIVRYPPRLKSFVYNNYLPAGTLFVAGKKLTDRSIDPNDLVEFNLAVPGRYALVTREGALVPGTLNGKHGTGVFDMETGRQAFIPSGKANALIVLWDKAWERGIHLSPWPMPVNHDPAHAGRVSK